MHGDKVGRSRITYIDATSYITSTILTNTCRLWPWWFMPDIHSNRMSTRCEACISCNYETEFPYHGDKVGRSRITYIDASYITSTILTNTCRLWPWWYMPDIHNNRMLTISKSGIMCWVSQICHNVISGYISLPRIAMWLPHLNKVEIRVSHLQICRGNNDLLVWGHNTRWYCKHYCM